MAVIYLRLSKRHNELNRNEIIMTFNNPYIAKGSVEIPGKKEVEGDLPDNTTFTFQLQQLVDGAWSDTIAPALVEKTATDGKVLIDAVNPKVLSEAGVEFAMPKGAFSHPCDFSSSVCGAWSVAIMSIVPSFNASINA